MTRKLVILTLSTLAALAVAAPAFAQDVAGQFSYAAAAAVLGAGLAIGIAGGLCGLGQGRAVASACEGTARNPGAGKQIFTLTIVGLALIESLAIYALVIAFMLLPEVPGLPS